MHLALLMTSVSCSWFFPRLYTNFNADISPLAWSMKNQLSIALGNLVYLWNADDGSVLQLMELSQPSDYISSVSWGKKGAYLAVGTSSAHVQIWDVNKQQKLRDLKMGNSVRVGCSDWNSFILARYFCSGHALKEGVFMYLYYYSTV